jgi:NAD(P)-dependent dehydrogenase (short-subunit alcohol dehydrogenase family)
MNRPVAIVTGASRGLGLALATQLARDNWCVIADARDADALARATLVDGPGEIVVVPGDITDPAHRRHLAAAAAARDGLALLVNNASALGPTPLPPLASYPIDALRAVYETNVVAPLALIQALLPQLRMAAGRVVNVSSDAGTEPYPGWGGYGSSKAALDQLSAVLAEEEPRLRVYAFDPGDMRTSMHAAAVPDEDPAQLPSPDTVVPALVRLIDGRLPSGRYRASELRAAVIR